MTITKWIILLSALSIANYGICATDKELIEVNSIVNQQCKEYARSDCRLYVNNADSSISAYSMIGGQIVLSQGLVNSFDKNELLAVALHECGHMINRDPETLAYISVHYPHLVTNRQYRYKIEFKADKFASEYFYSRCEHNYIYNAFKKLNKADWNASSDTHPSLNNRVNKIKDIEKKYVTNCK